MTEGAEEEEGQPPDAGGWTRRPSGGGRGLAPSPMRLGVTFYVPRRRLWVKITSDRTYLAGIAGHLANLRREMGKLGEEAGLPAPEASAVGGDGQAGWPDALEGQHDGSS